MTIVGGERAAASEEQRADVGRPPVGRGLKPSLVALDALVVGLVSALTWVLADHRSDDPLAGVLGVVACLVFLGSARLYSSRFITRRSDEVRRIIGAVARAGVVVVLAAFVLDLEVSRSWIGLAAAAWVVALVLERELVRRHFDGLRRSGRRRRRVILIGDNAEARHLMDMFAEEPELGYDVVAVVDPPERLQGRSLTTLALSVAREHGAVGAVVAASALEIRASNRLVRDLVEAGIHVELSSTLADIAPGRLTVRPLGRCPVFYIEPVRRGGWRAAAKRAFDLVAAGAVLVAAAPVLALIALAVKLTSPGPVLFRQVRVGQDGEQFEVLKFRTMVDGAESLLVGLRERNEGAGPLFKMRQDPRVTPVGRVLRAASLDELPQLWNVVRGEMSLVGPRPALASEMAAWGEDLYGRLRVKPGITGMWQVSGRSGTSFEEYTRLDLYYVDNWSLVVDLAILAKTVPAVLRRDGAY